ncbi:MAG TPA: Nif3-like dinuclear metal center hexameric protein [Chitinophagaceae bacterium]|jgi:dinuclear metal center YbgI/SA1388 family protein|nr:Nif3-like dinuclear metal center hexameric protein [Chitinophagaceae bacterium]
MKIREIIQVLEHYAAPELQEDWDNSGLLTGQAGEDCSGVLCALDMTPEVVAEAAAAGCNLVVAHHPVIFKGLRRLNGNNHVERTVIEAVRRGVALYAIHTNLDNIVLGVNDTIARKLGLEETKILQPKNRVLHRLITFAPHDQAETVRQALFDAGAGHIGNYSECSFNSKGTGTFRAGAGADPYVGKVGERHAEEETKIEIVYPAYMQTQIVQALEAAHPYEEVAYDVFQMENVHFGIGAGLIGSLPEPVDEEEMLRRIRDAFGAPVVRHTALHGRPVQRVAVCGGAGAFLIGAARRAGADLYLTADVKYHEFFEAEGTLLLADIGHYESEQFAVDLVRDLLLQKFPTFAVLKTGVDTNPVHYFT